MLFVSPNERASALRPEGGVGGECGGVGGRVGVGWGGLECGRVRVRVRVGWC